MDVDLEKAEAVVTFDDEKTTVDALVKATAAAGYPSSVKRKWPTGGRNGMYSQRVGR